MTSTETNRSATGPSYSSDTGEHGFGWLIFAASMLAIAGLMRVLDAIWAFSYKGALPDNLKDGVLGSNLKHYGWLWLIVGIVLIASSFLVLLRQSQIGRWVGMIAAAIAVVSSAAWLPYYPVWSLVYVSLGSLVLYALAAHGGHDNL
jgi:hypothetical protein